AEAKLLIKQLELEDKEDEVEILLWQKAKKENSMNLFHHYLEEFPEGKYKMLALAAIRDLETQERPDLVREGLSQGNHKGAAQIRTLFSKRNIIVASGIIALGLAWGFVSGVNTPNDRDQKAWAEAAVRMDSISLASYIRNFPNGKYLPAAKQKLDSLRALKPATKELEHHELTEPGTNTSMPPVEVTKEENNSTAQVTSNTNTTTKSPSNSRFNAGQQYQGGIIVYVNPTGMHGLIVSDKDLGTMEFSQATRRCAAYKSNGYDDWRLPSKEELNRVFQSHRKLGAFSKGMYWSQTSATDIMAWTQSLTDGHPGSFNKGMSCNVRAVRSF
ncbi:MAG TPA: DUF1566 domain-containing protein, partial [Saprospiraceae bacterium]|nr:DUF1566 domain-containing protein [Saprospiraceae bacterium]